MGDEKLGRKGSADAIEILHKRFYAGDPERLPALEDARLYAQIARQIFDLRISMGLSQRQLGNLIGTTAAVISRLEDAEYEGRAITRLSQIMVLRASMSIEIKPTSYLEIREGKAPAKRMIETGSVPYRERLD